MPDTQSGKAETSGGNAGHDALIVDVNVAAVLYHSRFRARLLPEKKGN